MISGQGVSTAFNGEITVYTGLSSDELYTTDQTSSDLQFYQNALNNNSNSQILWDNCYTVIYQANAVIAGVTASAGISAATKKQLIGESKLVRAMNYFHLVNLFGGVPLVLTTDYASTGSLPRASTTAVYAQVVTDLTDAQGELSANYVTSGKVRPNKYAATALLAKVYLYEQQWAKAEAAANEVISNGGYTMNASLNDVFLANSNEAIWQLQPVTQGYETPEGTTFVPNSSGTAPIYGINTFLLNSFEPGDQRRVDWIDSTEVAGVTYYFPYKYKLGNDFNSVPVENYMMLRLGEQYLIRAEARAEQNNIPDGLSDLNIIRRRAGLPNSTASSQTTLLTAIMHERQVELFCELGNRWYDLKRTQTVNIIMPPVCAAKGGGLEH